MAATVERGWSLNGVEVLRVCNDAIQVDLMPSVGGKIWGILDLSSRQQVLWQNPRVRPHVTAVASSIDDHFSGGWDEAFPTDYPCPDRYGQQIPDLGEVWTLQLEATVTSSDEGAITVSMSGFTPISTAFYAREVTVPGSGGEVQVRSKIRNVGPRPLDFIWGSHIAFAGVEGDLIEAPASRVKVENSNNADWGTEGETYPYPFVNDHGVDGRRVLSSDHGVSAFHILTGLTGDRIRATLSGTQVEVRFDPARTGALCQMMSYGGHRGWQVLIAEAWTNPERRLSDAVASGTAQTVDPGESWSTQVVLTVSP